MFAGFVQVQFLRRDPGLEVISRTSAKEIPSVAPCSLRCSYYVIVQFILVISTVPEYTS